MRSIFSTFPSLSARPASWPIAVTVPTVSKKSDSNRVKTRRITVISGTRSSDPKRLNWPKREKSGVATICSGIAGTFKFQPFGFTAPVAPLKSGPIFRVDSIAIAAMVAMIIPMRIAPFTFFTIKPIVRNSPRAKTTIGQPTRVPPSPRVTGTGPVPVRRTNPASTKPISAMKSPIPTEIAIFNWAGTALNTAVLNPVRTRMVIIIPSRTINPIASAQVICDAIPTATKVFRPKPVAIANGYLPITPIRMVNTPAMSAVIAATSAKFGASPPPMNFPSASFERPMISGLSATMYAIVKNVTIPPRTSLATVEPRCDILK